MSSGSRRVVITGIAGRLGRILARRLHRDGRSQVVGIDRRPFLGKPKDIEHIQVDLRSKKALDIFRTGVDALVHMGYEPAIPVLARHLTDFGSGANAAKRLREMGKVAIGQGMRTLRMVALDRAREGISTLEQCLLLTSAH